MLKLAFLLCLDSFNPNPPPVWFVTQLHIHFTRVRGTGGDGEGARQEIIFVSVIMP